MSTLKLDEIKSLQGTGNTVITFNSSDKAVFASQPVVPVPAFRAKAGAILSVTNNVQTLINLTVEDFDTHSWFNNANDYRFTPQIAGYYFLRGVLWSIGSTQSASAIYIYKNGAVYDFNIVRGINTNSGTGVEVSTIVYLNGSTDYVQVYGFVTAVSSLNFNVNAGLEDWATSKFEGFLVRAT